MTFTRSTKTGLLLGGGLLLSACSEPAPLEDSDPLPASTAITATDVDSPQVSWQAPDDCPSWASEDRPEGSNCHGIMPEACGADYAAAYVGKVGTVENKRKLQQIAVTEMRWLPPNAARLDDLSYWRLNVFLDENNVITEVDCF